MTESAHGLSERTLGKYHIVRPLKIGGTAAIYLAIMRGENNFSREVVIKRPLQHLVADRRSRLMFIDEAHIAARLSHPNICQVLDLVSRDDEVYLVLEYLRGVDLREVLKRCIELGRLTPPEVAVWVAIEVCAGLDFAHEAVGLDGLPLNLVHRDVSPKNIRITFSGSVKVIDFGIARAMNRATETAAGTIKGTLGYMSPEQILGDDIDRRSDIFAFGICLFQMLTCRNPFDGPTLKERVRRLTQAPVPSVKEFNPALDDEIEGIIARCLDRDVEQRYHRMRDVQIDLDRYLARLQVVSPRQRLIKFLEEIFPDQHEADAELKMALSEISSITGRIDTGVKIRFPDDPATDADVPSAGQRTAATVEQGTSPTVSPDAFGPERPTVSGRSRSQLGTDDTRPVTRERETEVVDPPAQPLPPPRRPFLLIGLAAVMAAAGVLTVALWPGGRIEVAQVVDPPPATPPPPQETSPGVAEPPVTPPPAVPPPGVAPPPVAPPPPQGRRVDVEPPTKVRTPAPAGDRERARLFFRTAVALNKSGRTDDARLLYVLSYAYSGKRPTAATYLNLGLLYNAEKNIPKAKACLRGYLERTEGSEADRVRTLLSSFPAVQSVPCVDGKELSHARRQYERRGADIDGWVDEVMASILD